MYPLKIFFWKLGFLKDTSHLDPREHKSGLILRVLSGHHRGCSVGGGPAVGPPLQKYPEASHTHTVFSSHLVAFGV